MTDDRFRQVERIYHQALELPAEQRSSFLERTCSGDSELQHEVQELLDHYEAARREATPIPVSRSALEHPATIGPFRINEVLGEGGMGVVYRAEQDKPIKRTVALKVIKLGMDSREVLARFQAERQALALMEHPNIARVFEAGATEEGRPYFAMEYVPGQPITEYCDAKKLSMRDRIELFTKVCAGIQYAHQKGIIHRDVKPTNVIVTEQDSRAVPKIIDFGVAKATDATRIAKSTFTQQGQLVGTPEYMSPEQAASKDLDTRTDVYSLGILLYELLVGTLPFDASLLREEGLDAMMRVIRESEPPRPSTRLSTLGDEARTTAYNRGTQSRSLIRALRGDLDWIVLKALEKDRDRRYPSVASFIEDLERHLQNEPVTARPPSAVYRTKKFVRRNRVAVAFAALLGASLVAVALTFFMQAQRIARERDRAKIAADTSREVAEYFGDAFHRTAVQNPGLKQLSAREALDSWADGISESDISPRARARLQRMLGRIYSSLSSGEEDRGKHLLEGSLALCREHFGADHIETADALRSLAQYETALMELNSARDHYTEAIAIYRNTVSQDDPRFLESCWTFAGLLHRLAQYEEALPYLQEALDGFIRVDGPESGKVSFVLNTMAVVQGNLDNYDTAIVLIKRAHDMQTKLYGPESFVTLMAEETLGEMYMHMGRLDDARRVLTKNLVAFEQKYGPTHSGVIRSMGVLGAVYMRMGHLDSAETHLVRAAEIGTMHAENNPGQTMTAASVKADLAGLYMRQKRYSSADSLWTEVISTSVRLLGPAHTSTISYLPSQGLTKFYLGQVAEADSLLRQALKLAQETGPQNGQVHTAIKRALGEFLFKTNRHAEAEPLLLDVHKTVAGNTFYNARAKAKMSNLVAEMYDSWGKPDLADRYRSSQ